MSGDSKFKKLADNKLTFQVGLGNCSIARCQEAIQTAIVPVSVTPSKYYDLYTCFLLDQRKDYYNIFAFTWTDPDTHFSTQLTWTVLPQGFWDSPHLFGQALASDYLCLFLNLRSYSM